ncbi:MAG: flagellar assembly protein T N-terminal domain-containing protein [Deltaproteobacteria bacterium]
MRKQEYSMQEHRGFVIPILAAAAVTIAAPAASAETQTIKVEGVAAVINDDIATARDRALDDAKRKAVEQVAGTQVSAQSITENFQLVEDKIYARASGFVKNYKIIAEYKEEGVYHVKIEATVDTARVAEDLEQIFATKPRVIVMIAEQNVGSKGFSYWWGNSGFVSDMGLMQTALIQQWQPRGYKFIDPALLSDKLQVQGAMRKPGVDNNMAVTLGRDADADIAIVGQVLVSDAGPVMDGVRMHSFHAVGNLRVLSIDTGEIIAVKEDTGVAPHIDPNMGGRLAIKALGKKISADLEKKILTKWTAEAASARDIELVARGAKSSSMVRKLQKVIKEQVRGVESVRVRRRKGGSAYLAVRVRARASDFGYDLENKTFEGFSVEVEDVTRSKVVVALKR